MERWSDGSQAGSESEGEHPRTYSCFFPSFDSAVVSTIASTAAGIPPLSPYAQCEQSCALLYFASHFTTLTGLRLRRNEDVGRWAGEAFHVFFLDLDLALSVLPSCRACNSKHHVGSLFFVVVD